VNGRKHDNPLSDFMTHGSHPFPADIEELLRGIDTLGRRGGCWPLGENWPYSPREFEWAKGMRGLTFSADQSFAAIFAPLVPARVVESGHWP
jgi:hypothetical protein